MSTGVALTFRKIFFLLSFLLISSARADSPLPEEFIALHATLRPWLGGLGTLSGDCSIPIQDGIKFWDPQEKDWKKDILDPMTSRSISEIRHPGQVQILYFFKTHCTACEKIRSQLNAYLMKKKKLRVLGITQLDDDQLLSHSSEWVTQSKFPVILLPVDANKTLTDYQVDDYPKVFILDDSGRIQYSGSVDSIRFKKVLSKALNTDEYISSRPCLPEGLTEKLERHDQECSP